MFDKIKSVFDSIHSHVMMGLNMLGIFFGLGFIKDDKLRLAVALLIMFVLALGVIHLVL